ncbi:MFS family permease [Actinoplanes tereljensis]|uniref:MFS transporter n=1 Tax=Paractinoplanes tereljensis TaxID=571912 RepID=A0A919TU16_9ACTN|nr:MFS transporter [Actinoplanes tereljensis]GIF20930.1 MFS transporter [Actinoplanes tereljensis]
MPLTVCLAAAFTTLLDQASLNTAVPALRNSLGAGPGTIGWIIAGYSLAFGLALVPGGRLGDAHGRKWLFVGGITVFSSAAIVAGTAQAAWLVAVARLVQGLGAGTVNPQVIGIIQELFTGRERTRALGAYSIVGGVSAVIGPFVGGLLIGTLGDEWGWRCVLLLNVPFGLLTVPLALKWFPSGRLSTRRSTLDLPGLAALGAATLCLLLPFTLPAGQGPPRPVWFATAVVLVAVLIAWERRYARSGGTPILMPALLRRPGYRNGVVIAMFQFGANLSATLALTLYLQEGLGWSALQAALTILPSAITFSVASALGWRVVGRYGRISVCWALIASLLAVIAAGLVVALAPVAHLAVGLIATQLVLGAASGLIVSPNQALTLGHAPPGVAGLAAAFLQLAQRISASIGMAAVTGVVLATMGTADSTPVVHGLAICAVMLAAGAFVAWRDSAGGPGRDDVVPGVPEQGQQRPLRRRVKSADNYRRAEFVEPGGRFPEPVPDQLDKRVGEPARDTEFEA